MLKSLKVGRKLRFKSRDRFKSFTYNQSGFSILQDRLRLAKIGKIKIVLHRKIEGLVKEIHIKRDSTGKWFAIIVTTTTNKITNTINKPIGLDVGIKNFVYDSDSHVVEHPSILKQSAKKLGKAQRILSRRIKGSHNRYKQRLKVARIHEKIGNQRKDFLHKLSRQYINKYNPIFVEDLKIDNMIRNQRLSKSIADSSWSTFFNMLQYKAENAGIVFRKVLPHGTSQKCSRCGEIVEKTLAIRMYCCLSCNLNIDRDLNASINILQNGLDNLPQELREVTPVEIEPIQTNKQTSLQVRSMNQEATHFNERWFTETLAAVAVYNNKQFPYFSKICLLQ